MDRGKKPCNSVESRNNKIYMDLKDVIRVNALPFLPAKSLCRCTSVCRDWKLQISSPFFAHTQSNAFHDISGFFCQNKSSQFPSFISLDPAAYGLPDPSLTFLPEPVDIRCSSNGLLCCQGCTESKAYYICNPVTRKWKKLPKPNADHGSTPALVLVFEPSVLSFVAEYMLICAFPSELDGYEFEIYSSAEGSWRISPEIIFGNRELVPTSGVHVGGIIYWLSRCSGIVAFDLKNERTRLLYGYALGALGEVNGKLYSASLHGSKLTVVELCNSFTNTMQMHSKQKSWNMKVEINLMGPLLDPGSNVVFVGGNLVLIRSGKRIVSVDMKTQTTTTLTAELDYSSRVVHYVNSLVEI
ncbi:hypothetical protein K2173_021432 [Erythroxylum novogranatense]|uniref:F-box protein At3g26010-like beta-propeller domain-containing protein n=1 Tax=Erythroxylum novogranatense TaxID=1862640 RepID=A0AAV8TV24_9ROSI|nr:hypothetical protein K2173_021432 [Erythroxylum novogranatense]